jgi:hypothetical protein
MRFKFTRGGGAGGWTIIKTFFEGNETCVSLQMIRSIQTIQSTVKLVETVIKLTGLLLCGPFLCMISCLQILSTLNWPDIKSKFPTVARKYFTLTFKSKLSFITYQQEVI